VADHPFNVLFLCTGNSARSIMAEAILNRLGAGKFRGYSAGSQPKGLPHPEAIQLLQGLGYDTSGFRSKSWNEFAKPGAPSLDFAFTVCDNAAGEVCRAWPGQPMAAHWGIPDPAEAKGNTAEIALGVQGRLSHAASAHRHINGAAVALARPPKLANQAARDRPHAGNRGKGCRADVMAPLAQRSAAECLGTAFLLAAVVGSGIMAAKLSGGNGALALLCNTLPTGAMLAVLILIFAPISGAHFNPAVSLAFALRGELSAPNAAVYIGAQVIGGILGVWAAHLMFELPLWQVSLTTRTGPGQWFAEAVATFGLLLTVLGCGARTPAAVPYAAGLYIISAYWFTASTSFANPAVTIARSLSDTFAGIAPTGIIMFIAAQLTGMLAAVLAASWFWRS